MVTVRTAVPNRLGDRITKNGTDGSGASRTRSQSRLFCDIPIPIPGRLEAGITFERLTLIERLLH
jgi:hypothetical protein